MTSTQHVFGWFRAVLAGSLAVTGALYLPLTWRWPLVGDASLIHYIAFLIERGWAPYRQLGDMNMPGSFLIELAAMHVFGPGGLAWRLFDFATCLAGGAAIYAVCTRRRWLPALFAASLLVLIHGRDGLAQGGQRDLTMAVCLIAATACLLTTVRTRSIAAAVGFGLLSGVAVTIKPTALLLTIAQALLAWHAGQSGDREPSASFRRRCGPAVFLAWLIAPLGCVVFLLREKAVGAFLIGLQGIVPYYASLGHRSLGYVLAHSLSPIEPLAALWLLVVRLRGEPLRRYLDVRHRLLGAGVLFGLGNCVVQHRALPYYRYPLLAFLLPLIAVDLFAAAEGLIDSGLPQQNPPIETRPRGWVTPLAGVLAVAGLAFGGLFLAPQSALQIGRYRWRQTEMLDSLERTLQSLGGQALSGQVQCIDSVSGCGTVLYRMRLEPATGVLSDFLLFGNTTDSVPPDEIPVVRKTRAEFLASIASRPPQVIIVTSHLHMTGPENYGKLGRWPQLAQILETQYLLAADWRPTRPERWWSREEYPAGYRVYVLRKQS